MKLACPLLLVTVFFLIKPAMLFPTGDGTVLDVEETSSADGFLHVKVVEDLRRNSSPEIEKSSKVGVSVPVGGRGNHHGKRRNGNKHRQSNEKKGKKKAPKRPKENPVTYRTRSPLTDQFNQAVDELLLHLSQSTIQGNHRGNVTLHLKVANMPRSLRVLPWAYKAVRSSVVKNTTGLSEASVDDVVVGAPLVAASDNETAKVEPIFEELIEEEADATQGEDDIVVQVEGSEDEVVDDDDEQADAEQSQPSTEEPLTAIDSVSESPDLSIDEIIEAEEEELVECSSHEDEQDQDCQPTEEAGESTEDSDNIEGAGQLSLTSQPDGSVEFSLQLTADAEDEAPVAKETSTEHGSRGRQSRHRGRFNKKGRKQSRKQQARNMPRQPNAVVTGLEQLRRVDDILIGDKDNGMARVIDVPILIGPVIISMKGSALPSMRKARATSPPLPAQLRLVERDGKLVVVQLKPKSMSPRQTLVTVKRRNGQELPTKRQSARLVTHLSNEMSRIWNSGLVLHRMGRRLKKTYKSDASLQTLIKQLQPQAPVAAHHDARVEKLTMSKADEDVSSLLTTSTHDA